MNLLTMEHVTKAYTDRVLLDDVAFGINENEKIGVIGINGMGKSTLLKIVAGVEEYDSGNLSMGNTVKICYLPQTPVFGEEETVLQAAVRGIISDTDQWMMEAEAKSMLNQLGFSDYEEKMSHMSGGQKKRVALVNALLTPADILVLDEPTNHLDNAMSEWLEEYLIRFRGAILMVTHDRYFLDRVANRIVEVDHGNLYNYPGSYSEFVKLKEERQNMALATQRKRKSLLRTELEWLSRGARARSTKQKAHIDRIKAMQEMKDIQEERRVAMDSVASRMGNKTIEVSGLCKSYGDKKLIDNYEYIFLKNDRVGFVGTNGCGKTTLMKLLAGREEPDSGSIKVGQTIRIGYYSQEIETSKEAGIAYMDPKMRVIDYIRETAEFVRTEDGLISASAMLERFLFPPQAQYSLIGKLSGGERRRLNLLRVLMESPNVLILDEPTNDLDISTLTILEDYLDHFQGIVITVSHDRYFLDRVVRRIFAFEGGGAIRQYEGGYTDYQAACGERIAAEMEASGQEHGRGQKTGGASGAGTSDAAETAKDKNRGRQREKKLKFSYMEQKEWETIEDDIAALEEAIADLEQQMQDSARDYTALNGIIKEKEEKDDQTISDSKNHRETGLE